MKRVALSLLGLCAVAPAGPTDDRVLTDFGSNGLPLQWYSVNDGVMGGRSSGAFKVTDGVLRFSGVLNTNGGGFASIRTRPAQLGLASAEGIHLRVRGDGRTYTARLQESDGGRAVSYRAEFATTKSGEWQDVWLPFRSFVATWRGRVLDRPPVDAQRVQVLGLMMADKKDGAFSLEVGSISAYAPFSMERYHWKSRPLVVCAPDADDKRLRKQIASILESAAPFAERDMILVVLLEKGTSYVGTRPIGAEQVAALRKQYDVEAGAFALKLIGKDGGVKRSESAPLALPPIFDQIDSMPMRQREMDSD